MTDAKQAAPEHNEACGQNWIKGECPGCVHQMREYDADPEFVVYDGDYEYRATWEAAQWNLRVRNLVDDGGASLGVTRTREEAEFRIEAEREYAETGVWRILHY